MFIIKRIFLCCFCFLAITTGDARAVLLSEALKQAYQTNPQIKSSKAQLRASYELYNQSLAFYRPDISASSSFTYQKELDETRFGAEKEREFFNNSLSIRQFLYRGGRTSATEAKATSDVLRQQSAFDDTVQNVLFNTVDSYMSLIRAKSVVDLNRKTFQVLEKNLEATRQRFDAGDVTLTDIAQAESRLAQTRADLVSSEREYNTMQAKFFRLTGLKADNTQAPNIAVNLPATREEALEIALQNSPRLRAAHYSKEAARFMVREKQGALLPEISASGDLTNRDGDSISNVDQTTLSLTGRVSIPLYQGGRNYAAIRESKLVEMQRHYAWLDEKKAIEEQISSIWNNLAAIRATIEATNTAIKSANTALDGIRQEALFGSRTVLDILDAERELLNTKVQLVDAQYNEVLAQYSLLSAMGKLIPSHLKISTTQFDHKADFNKNKGKLIGTDIDSDYENIN
jgi:TolC family type I secretion outer membrane protein